MHEASAGKFGLLANQGISGSISQNLRYKTLLKSVFKMGSVVSPNPEINYFFFFKWGEEFMVKSSH